MNLLSCKINWNQVYYFSLIASCGSIKFASQKVGLSSSTLSGHLSQLEKTLNVQLFLRHSRRLKLTSEGERFFQKAKEMFETGERFMEMVFPTPIGTTPVSVGLVPTPSVRMAYKYLGDFIEQTKSLNVNIIHSTYSELELGLANGKIDFGFSDRIPNRRDIHCHLVSSSIVRFYVSEIFHEKKFSDLIRDLPLLIGNSELGTKAFSEQFFQDSGIRPAAIVTSDYPGVLIDLCSRGLGIGVFSEEPIKKMNLENLRSFRVPKEAPRFNDRLYVLWIKESDGRDIIKKLKRQFKIDRLTKVIH